MDWKIQPEGREPDPELEKAIEAAARVAAAVDQATAQVAPGVRLLGLSGLVGILAARLGASLDPIFELIKDLYEQEGRRIVNRGH